MRGKDRVFQQGFFQQELYDPMDQLAYNRVSRDSPPYVDILPNFLGKVKFFWAKEENLTNKIFFGKIEEKEMR